MEEQLNLFFKFLETEKKASKNTLQSYRRDLEQFEKYIQKTARIPMRKTLRSLNLSNSVAIVAYEILRQKNFENLQEVSTYFDEKN